MFYSLLCLDIVNSGLVNTINKVFFCCHRKAFSFDMSCGIQGIYMGLANTSQDLQGPYWSSHWKPDSIPGSIKCPCIRRCMDIDGVYRYSADHCEVPAVVPNQWGDIGPLDFIIQCVSESSDTSSRTDTWTKLELKPTLIQNDLLRSFLILAML